MNRQSRKQRAKRNEATGKAEKCCGAGGVWAAGAGWAVDTALCSDSVSVAGHEGVARSSHWLGGVAAGGIIVKPHRRHRVGVVHARSVTTNCSSLKHAASRPLHSQTVTTRIQIPSLATWHFGHLAI